MSKAQDEAVVQLARQRGILSGGALRRAEELLGEGLSSPLPQVLAAEQLVSHDELNHLLHELQLGHFECESCGIRVGFDALGILPALRCQCGNKLVFGAEGPPPSSGGYPAVGGPTSSAYGSAYGPGASAAGPRSSGAGPRGSAVASRTGPGSGARPAAAPPQASASGQPAAAWDGEATIVDKRTIQVSKAVAKQTGKLAGAKSAGVGESPRGKRPTVPPPGDDEPLIKPVQVWDGEATVLEPKRRRPPSSLDDEDTEQGTPAPRPPSSHGGSQVGSAVEPLAPPRETRKRRRASSERGERPTRPQTHAAPPAGAGSSGVGYDPDEETVRDRTVLRTPEGLSSGGSVETGPPSEENGGLGKLGSYTLLRELGRGGNGVIFLARHQGLERRFAVKVLRGGDLIDEETVMRFRLEAAVASKIQDPGIIGVYDVGKDGDRYYYAMEYCPGETLEQRLAGGPLNPRQAAVLLRQVAESIHVAHSHGVIHRDLKPGNILIEESSGRPRITDFGVARDHTIMGPMTRTGEMLGTPNYMAPEQLMGDKDVDHRVDIYALGVMLFECLTGRLPFEAKTAVLLAEKVCTSPPTHPSVHEPSLPHSIERICLRAIQREREQRYRTAKAFAADLERFLAGEEPVARDPGAGRWKLLAGAAALVFVLALGGGFWFKSIRDSRQRAALGESLGKLEEWRQGLVLDEAVVLEHLNRARELEPSGSQGAQLEALERVYDVRSRLHQAEQGARGLDAYTSLTERLQEALELAQPDPALAAEVRLALADLACRRQQLRAALEWTDGLVSGDDDAQRPRALAAREIRMVALDRLGRAIDAEEQARQLAEAGDGLHSRVARSYLAYWDRSQSELVAETEAALELDPEHVSAMVVLAEDLLERQDMTGAREQLESARRLRPDDVWLLQLLARATREDDPRRALTLLGQAIGLSGPDRPLSALLARARISFDLGKLTDARADLNRLLDEPGQRQDPEVLLLSARVHYALGQDRESREEWRDAYRINSTRFKEVMREVPPVERREMGRAVGLSSGRREPRPQPSETRQVSAPRFNRVSEELDQGLAAWAEWAPAERRQGVVEVVQRAARGESWRGLERRLTQLERELGQRAELALLRARLALGREAYDEALKALEAGGTQNAARAEAELLKGEVALRSGDSERARARFQDAQKHGQGWVKTAGQALVALLEGDFQTAHDRAAAARQERGQPEPLLGVLWLQALRGAEGTGAGFAALQSVADDYALLDVGVLVVAFETFGGQFLSGALGATLDQAVLQEVLGLYELTNRLGEGVGARLALARATLVVGDPRLKQFGARAAEEALRLQPELPLTGWVAGLFCLSPRAGAAGAERCLQFWGQVRQRTGLSPPAWCRQLYARLRGPGAELDAFLERG